MPRVTFGSAIQRHIQVPPLDVKGSTVRAALDEVFALHSRVKGYVLDDQSALRKHMHIFVDGVAMRDRRGLSDTVEPASHIYVVQALSGG